MTTAPYLLHIPFVGTRPGAYPLTWGQHWVWESAAARAPYYADLSGNFIVAVPDGCDLDGVAAGLAALLDRYETFRSTYSIAADGQPQQVVLARGRLRVEVRDVDAAEAEEAALAVRREFDQLPFTLPEPALRATVIAADGVPRFVVLSTFHMAMDCHGMPGVLDDLRSLLGGTSPDDAHPASDGLTHPVDRALEEQQEQSVQRSARGVRFWAGALARFPADPFPYTGRRPEHPRHRTYTLRSRALHGAVLGIAQEMGVTASSVVLALAASGLARRNGSRTCGVVLVASHRYDPRSMRYAGTLVQGVPVVVDVSGDPPRALVPRCHRAGMLAALAGHCHPGDLARMLRDTYGPDAAAARLACVMNLNLPAAEDSAEAGGPPVSRAELEALRAESRFDYVEGTPVENERFYLAAGLDEKDLVITVRADTAALSSTEITEFLRELERSALDCLA